VSQLPWRHEFELSGTGDEVGPEDLGEATYKVTDTYVDVQDGFIIFTHRVELHVTDDQMIELIQHNLEQDARGESDEEGDP
jgi:hypothetical protein